MQCKVFGDSVGTKDASLEDEFCSMFLQLSVLPRWRERPQTDMFCSEWLGRLKCDTTGLDAFYS